MLCAISCAGSVRTRTEVHFSADDSRLARRGAARPLHDDRRRDERCRARQAGASCCRESSASPDADLDLLVKDATEAENDAVDLYRFTSVLKRQMSEDERIRVIENLWEIAFADGVSHEFEENLVWRVAELLGVSARDRIVAKAAGSGK